MWRCWVRSGGRKAKNCGFPVETRRVNPVYCDDLKMQVEIGGRSKSLHERDSAALGLVDAVIPSHAAVPAEDSPDEDAHTAVTISAS